jgi:enoyl-CoA hydratase/carnithine racemase
MSGIEWKKEESVAIISMNEGDNKHNLDFANKLSTAIDEVLSDQDVLSIVLTSGDPKIWSIGVDVMWVQEQMQTDNHEKIKAFMYGMNTVFKKLLLAPVPVIAAINGHAFGNGAILSCACDFRFMRSDRGYFCFPEVDLGIPFLPGMIAFVKKAMPYYKFNELKLTGKRASASELETHHVIEKACENTESLMDTSIAFAKTLQKKRGIFGEHKKRMHKSIIETIEKEDPAYIDTLFLFVSD